MLPLTILSLRCFHKLKENDKLCSYFLAFMEYTSLQVNSHQSKRSKFDSVESISISLISWWRFMRIRWKCQKLRRQGKRWQNNNNRQLKDISIRRIITSLLYMYIRFSEALRIINSQNRKGIVSLFRRIAYEETSCLPSFLQKGATFLLRSTPEIPAENRS